jgi:energy-coupling factor transporter ATP-binding protein EcfA2
MASLLDIVVDANGELGKDFTTAILAVDKKYKNIIAKIQSDIKCIKLLGFKVEDKLAYRDMVNKYLSINDIKISYSGKITGYNKDLNSLGNYISVLFAECGISIPRHIYNQAFSLIAEQHQDNWLDNLRQSIKFDGNNFDWNKVVSAIAKKESADDEYNVLSAETTVEVLKSWCWQVKRKIYNLPVYDHFMINLYGKQGSGKSSFIKALSAPLSDVTSITASNEFTDNRNFSLFRNFIVFLDELDRLERQSAETVKSRITCDYIDTRILFSNSGASIKNNTTVIGASNKSIRDMFSDTTGFRRFVEIETLDKMDFKALEEIDWLAAWKSIDENMNRNTIIGNDEIYEQQEKNTTKTSVELWLDYSIDSLRGEEDYTATVLYTLYKDWNVKYANGVMSIKKFCSTLMLYAEKYKITKVKKSSAACYRFGDNKIISINDNSLREKYLKGIKK